MTRQSAGTILLNDKGSGLNERTYERTITHCGRTRLATKVWGSLRSRLLLTLLRLAPNYKGSVTRSGKSQRHVAGTCRLQRVTRSDKARRKQVAQALIRAWSHEPTFSCDKSQCKITILVVFTLHFSVSAARVAMLKYSVLAVMEMIFCGWSN